VAQVAVPKLPVWVASWGASLQSPEPANALAAADQRDITMRQVVHLSLGGAELRVHVSNAFGSAALHFTSVDIAYPAAAGAIQPGSDRRLTFAGRMDVTVPPGAEVVSDVVSFRTAPLSDLAISFHVEEFPGGMTGHTASRATSYFVHGDFADAVSLPAASQIEHWYQISAVDVTEPAGAAVVALGDSITDGHGATTNGNDRWPDVLAARLQASAATRMVGVSNQGISGNHVLTDGLGPNALSRFDRDVLAPAGARWVIVLEGVNDLAGLTFAAPVSAELHAARVQGVEFGLQQIITRAHAHGLLVYGGTITPYMGSDYYHPGPENEVDRLAVNAWIRAAGHFDRVIDFDAVVRDPEHPERFLPAYDCGDHLHPGPAGYKAMGSAIPLELFQ
jgi:lysophospholipase L1-like esterase